jgi:hypothetical protein
MQPTFGGPAHLLRFQVLTVAAHSILVIALLYYHRRWTCHPYQRLVNQSWKRRCNHRKGLLVPQNLSPRIQHIACTILSWLRPCTLHFD